MQTDSDNKGTRSSFFGNTRKRSNSEAISRLATRAWALFVQGETAIAGVRQVLHKMQESLLKQHEKERERMARIVISFDDVLQKHPEKFREIQAARSECSAELEAGRKAPLEAENFILSISKLLQKRSGENLSKYIEMKALIEQYRIDSSMEQDVKACVATWRGSSEEAATTTGSILSMFENWAETSCSEREGTYVIQEAVVRSLSESSQMVVQTSTIAQPPSSPEIARRLKSELDTFSEQMASATTASLAESKPQDSVVVQQRVAALKDRVDEIGYRLVDVGRDGNCFAHVVMDQLKLLGIDEENFNTPAKIRAATVAEIRGNFSRYAQFIPSEDQPTYLDSLAVEGAFFDQVAVRAFSNRSQLAIVTIAHTGGPAQIQTPEKCLGAIVVGCELDKHFQSLHRIESTDGGPFGNLTPPLKAQISPQKQKSYENTDDDGASQESDHFPPALGI